ncbi:unnamed protein product [Clonostachys solani]|uniref:Uncharacterized protein n=1 Tax=Clonostachys solani TaxID=160281 RepID=A0A9N9YSF0_9HYPO|nr:unnamed protein product [Clonostachys solani]
MQPLAQLEQMRNDGGSSGEPECHILRLPTELFQIVIDCLSEDEVASTEKNLLSLCLSSKALLIQAKSRLYKFNADWVSAEKKPRRRWACLDWAIQSGRKETVESVMNFTPEVCELHHLSRAIRKKHFEIAWMLLKREPLHTKLKTRTQDSPIFAAVEAGHTQLIDDIIKIQKGLDVSMMDRKGNTVLHHACRHGHLNLVRRFLDEKANPYAPGKSIPAISPLMSAIQCGLPTARYAIIETILASRPSFQHSDREYRDYMWRIARKCNLDDLKLFMRRGFFNQFLNDPPDCSTRLERWLYWFGEAGIYGTEIFRGLLELCPREHFTDILFNEVFAMIPIPKVSGVIGVREVKILIDRFKPTAITDFWPTTHDSLQRAMSHAIRRDEVDLMESLLHFYGLVGQSQDPEFNLRPSKWNMIMYIIEFPHSSGMLKLLLRHGFDVNHVEHGPDGQTTLQRAIKEVQAYEAGIEAIKDMIPMVENINAVDGRERTALHLCVTPQATPQRKAVLDRVMEIANILINNEAKLSARDHEGNTPLHFAASSRHLDPFVQFFLDRGARIDALNHNGETPLRFLMAWGDSPTEETPRDRLWLSDISGDYPGLSMSGLSIN